MLLLQVQTGQLYAEMTSQMFAGPGCIAAQMHFQDSCTNKLGVQLQTSVSNN